MAVLIVVCLNKDGCREWSLVKPLSSSNKGGGKESHCLPACGLAACASRLQEAWTSPVLSSRICPLLRFPGELSQASSASPVTLQYNQTCYLCLYGDFVPQQYFHI